MTGITAIFYDYTFLIVALGCALFGIASGVLGCFAVLRRQSLLGDGISHAALPGIVFAFLLTGNRSTEVLQLGALISGLAATFIILRVTKHSRIKFDSATALVMAAFFGLGLVLLTYSQRQSGANQAGLKRFIYGQASTLLLRDVLVIAAGGAALLLIVLLFRKEFKLLSFDAEFARSLGLKTERLSLLLSLLTVFAIIIGLQTVGVVLMSAMLISPAVAARQWTDRLGVMALLAAIFGAVSGVFGAFISSALTGVPTGPSIAVSVSFIAVFSLLFAPGRGVAAKIVKRAKIVRRGINESRI